MLRAVAAENASVINHADASPKALIGFSRPVKLGKAVALCMSYHIDYFSKKTK